MPPIEQHMSFGIVQDDVRVALGEIFTPENGNAFSVVEAFEGEEVIANAEERVVAVPWRYRGRHEGDFRGLRPTGRELEITGVTLVDRRGGEIQLHRYVDWAGVIAQLGLHVSGRVLVEEDEYRQ